MTYRETEGCPLVAYVDSPPGMEPVGWLMPSPRRWVSIEPIQPYGPCWEDHEWREAYLAAHRDRRPVFAYIEGHR